MPKPIKEDTQKIHEENEHLAAMKAPSPAQPEGEPFIPAIPAAKPDEDGYYGNADWVRIECGWDGLKPRDGFKPLWAEFDASLTWAEANAIPGPWGISFIELYPYIVPRVRAWNCKRRNPETGETELVGAPSEIGVEAFQHVQPMVIVWLAFTLKTIHLAGGPNRKNETSASDAGPSGISDEP